MTTRFPSLGSLRALAASSRRGRLAGSTWSTIIDRDLDRVASDLLLLAHADIAQSASGAERVDSEGTRPVDLHGRRAHGLRPTRHHDTSPQARAS